MRRLAHWGCTPGQQKKGTVIARQCHSPRESVGRGESAINLGPGRGGGCIGGRRRMGHWGLAKVEHVRGTTTVREQVACMMCKWARGGPRPGGGGGGGVGGACLDGRTNGRVMGNGPYHGAPGALDGPGGQPLRWGGRAMGIVGERGATWAERWRAMSVFVLGCVDQNQSLPAVFRPLRSRGGWLKHSINWKVDYGPD